MFVMVSFLIGVLLIIFVLHIMSFILSDNSFLKSKSTSFECGFHSVGILQKSFSMQFFSIMLMFIIFDVEVVLFLGLLLKMSLKGSMFILIFFVIGGLWLEWYLGKLMWMN